MSKKKLHCTNPEIGRLLDDAKSDALLAPGRERDRYLFFDVHIDECPSCRAAMLDHANAIAITEMAFDRQVSIEEVLEDLIQAAQRLQQTARKEGLSLAQVLGQR
jgi:predicted anti-sigma-YlaC factor YlaD